MSPASSFHRKGQSWLQTQGEGAKGRYLGLIPALRALRGRGHWLKEASEGTKQGKNIPRAKYVYLEDFTGVRQAAGPIKITLMYTPDVTDPEKHSTSSGGGRVSSDDDIKYVYY